MEVRYEDAVLLLFFFSTGSSLSQNYVMSLMLLCFKSFARMDPHSLVDLSEDKEVDAEFMYSVKWKETETPFEKRMEKYSMSSHHLEIHWFSIINSCVTVLLLTGFLATILMRVLKNDFMKYAQDEEAADDQEETGWKYIHGDVFRFPTHNSLFAASLGSGTQLFTLTIFIFMLALVGVFYPYNRGALFTALVVIYALTSGIALLILQLHVIAVTSPLLVLGGIAVKNSKAEFQAPCRTTKYPREIPPLPWYRSAVPQMAMAGFLPFSAIYIELYYIFASSIRVDERHIPGYIVKENFLLLAKRPEAAAIAFRAAQNLRLSTFLFGIWQNQRSVVYLGAAIALADLHLMEGRNGDAVSLLERYLKDWADESLYAKLAQVFAATNMLQDSLSHYQAALRINPQNEAATADGPKNIETTLSLF
ncbi:hypothetical protein Bca52824_079021 [Brassica carinata]|uniref:Transmembrane 9 superfamily member n=1 Tax=Brassica carinata TaxID=52824 RepID=A0A8X7TYY2_BRACI|nr:hypothetical protein Bca52824_079021 [Brassica carinata]